MVVQRARELGLQEGLRYVYVGNIPGDHGEHTTCPQCGRAIIRRMGYTILANDTDGGRCRHCGARLDGVGI